ncbi:MAG: tetratricopeptide repeat protein [Nitrosopumilus sp.]|uniref:tetratricopeptide repeat protein n=1 Tax=Nitrosopumilus sp. TaxID=2024843 RepID=UPI00247BDD76|nr:tetratricopeptide repeat protein [Nitrosopumilus sp.]MCV0393618.1 tetratricopeptide repeat protein [Nitrosopumilus sp.]
MEPENHELLLPLVDEENICLPLPINVVSKYWNVQLPMVEAQEIAKNYSGYSGSILIEGIELAERHGLTCKIIHSSLSELKKIIDVGIPPIVILPGIPEITQHASVITGYDIEEKSILHYIQKGNKEGEQQEGAIPEEIFDKQWAEEGRLLIILTTSDILSSINLESNDNESNRLCLISERYQIQNNFAKAGELLKKAIELNPNNSTALHLYGSLLNSQKSSECTQFYEKCLKSNPNSYLSYNGLGNFYLKSNKFEKAEENYTKAIEINPNRSAKIYKNRAYIREKQNNISGAKEDLKNYLKYYPRAPDRGIIEQAIREL